MQLIFVATNLLLLVQSGVLSTSYPKTDCCKIGTERIEYGHPMQSKIECICKVKYFYYFYSFFKLKFLYNKVGIHREKLYFL